MSAGVGCLRSEAGSNDSATKRGRLESADAFRAPHDRMKQAASNLLQAVCLEYFSIHEIPFSNARESSPAICGILREQENG